MTSYRGVRVEALDGGWVVKGTLDHDEARQALAYEGSSCTCDPCRHDVHECTPEPSYARWFRIMPGCPDWCGEGHYSHLVPDRPRKRGAFMAVVFE
jgi:hypothetical protein